MNRLITKFKFKGSDANDKPSTVNDNGKTLGGHAVQNWCLLRFLPLIIGLRIQDCSDRVWAAVLLLRRIVELICSPKITSAQVADLRIKIDEYIELRVSLFPAIPLRPKHHFLVHYPKQILQLGSLIRV